MINWFFYKTKSVSFWIVALLCTFAYIFLLLHFEYLHKACPESYPTILEVTEKTKRLATTVDVGMHIKTFPSFSITSGLFIVEAIVWFRFAESTESLHTLENFVIKNSQLLDSHAVMHVSKPIVKLLGDQVLVAYNVQAKFQSSLEYKKFPLGNHRLNIVLVNEAVTPHELVFNTKSTYVTLSNDIMVDDWKPIKMHATSGYLRSELDKDNQTLSLDYPCASFSIDFDRVGYRSLVSLYFPLLVLFLIGLLSLMISIFDLTRLGMISGSLPMLVLYRLVIDANSPQIAYTTHIDFVFYTLVLLSLPILIWQMYVTLEGQKIAKMNDEMARNKIRTFMEKINSVVFLGVLLSLIILLTYNFLR